MALKKFWFLPLLTVAVLAAENVADISGQWTGLIEVNDRDSGTIVQTPVIAEFQQKDRGISGKIGRKGDDERVQIKNAKVEGRRVSFECSSLETTSPMKFNLTLNGDQLDGLMKGSVESGEITGKVRLKRQKSSSN